MTILFLIVINFLTSNEHPWFIYPAYVLVLFPIALICVLKKQYKLLSIIGSIWTLSFLIIINHLNTPDNPWVLYTIVPLLMCPVLVLLDQKAKRISIAICGSLAITLYYLLLNVYLSPYYPWAIFPAFIVIWWPLFLYHFKRKSYFQLSLHGSVLISAFFIIVNAISSPNNVWAVYPIFGVLWWPLSMYYFGSEKS